MHKSLLWNYYCSFFFVKIRQTKKETAYCMIVSFLGDVAVAITPVKGDLLFFLLIQPDELLCCL